MGPGALVRAARLRKGLTQRELAARARVPQPMISSIERGVQDPRHSTLERILAVCDQTIDIAPIAGRGVDPTQFVESLRLTPGERLRSAAAATRNVGRFLKEARRIRKR